MSKAEAIVVSEPKQKVVPDFNEKEVIGIVNSGIQTGQVALPKGGAKLYYHAILLKTSVAYQKITVTSPIKESFDTIDSAVTGIIAICGGARGYGPNTNAKTGAIFDFQKPGSYQFQILTSTGVESLNFNASDIDEDTITEL